MKALLFACLLAIAANAADAQQRRPAESDRAADKPPDCASSMGALPKD